MWILVLQFTPTHFSFLFSVCNTESPHTFSFSSGNGLWHSCAAVLLIFSEGPWIGLSDHNLTVPLGVNTRSLKPRTPIWFSCSVGIKEKLLYFVSFTVVKLCALIYGAMKGLYRQCNFEFPNYISSQIGKKKKFLKNSNNQIKYNKKVHFRLNNFFH